MSASSPTVFSCEGSTIFKRIFLSACLLCITNLSQAQPQVVTQTLINQYGLDFSDPQPETVPYELVIGSNGALYLRDNSNNSYKKISKRMNGVPAKVETGFPGNSLTYYQADKNFDRIVYISKDPNITPGDSGDSEDVFVYSLSEDKTIRVVGNNSHEGTIRQVRINAKGDRVAFGSTDWYFGDTSRLNTNGAGLDEFNGAVGLVYISNEINFDSVTDSPYTPVGFVNTDNTGLNLCADGCQFYGDSLTLTYDFSYPLAEYFWQAIYDFDISQEILTEVVQEYNDERTYNTYSTTNLDDSRHILVATSETQLADFFDEVESSIYDTLLNDKFTFTEEYPLVMHNGYNFDDSFQKVSGATSQDSRYITFHSKKLEYVDGDEQNPEYNTGIIYVYDTWTDDLKPAFTVDRTALSYGGYFNNTLGKMTCINCDGIDDYEIEPANIRFHNNNQYITFEGNSWYLDPTVPYDSFAVPYARDQFVVENPFNSDDDQATCGEPDTSISAQGGTYLWRDCATGQWQLQVIGDDSKQNIAGIIVADQGINNIMAVNLEATDQYNSSATELRFDLDAQTGDDDGFSFYLTRLTGSCIDITNTDSVYVTVGARQIALTVPFDLEKLEPVSDCGNDGTIAVDGAPEINYATDQGWFIWRENGIWQSRFSAGGTEIQFIGSLESTLPMSNLLPNSIEPRDLLELNPATLVNFNIYVTGPYRDGFSVAISNSANTCATLASPSGVNIYIGPDAVLMPNSFDLTTLEPCQNSLNIVGEPNIDASSKTGAYVWQDTSGRTFIKLLASEDNEIDRFTGAVFAANQINSLLREAGVTLPFVSRDKLVQLAFNQVNFDLYTRRFNASNNKLNFDLFSFFADPGQSLCLTLDEFSGGLFLGPDKTQVQPPFDLSLLTSCDLDKLAVDGRPAIDRRNDRGVFVWKNQAEKWQVEVVIGAGNKNQSVNIDSVDNGITNYTPLSIEPSDDVLETPGKLYLNLRIWHPSYDAFEFNVLPATQGCFSVAGFDSLPIYLGPDRVEMIDEFDLNTQQACQYLF